VILRVARDSAWTRKHSGTAHSTLRVLEVMVPTGADYETTLG
jgi:hypothetical protein